MRGGRGLAGVVRVVGVGAVLSLVVACSASDADWDAAREEFAVEGPAILEAADAAFAATGEVPANIEDLGLDDAAITPSGSDFSYDYRAGAPLSDEVRCEAELTLVEQRVDVDVADEDSALMTSLCDPEVAAADRVTAADLARQAQTDFVVIVGALDEHASRVGSYPLALTELGLSESDLSAEVDGVTANLRVYLSDEPGSYAYKALNPDGGDPCRYELIALWPHGDFRELRQESDQCPATP